jgi:hypothetical protein
MHGGSLSDKSSSSVRGRQAVGVDSEAMRLHLSEMVPSRQRGSAVSWIFTIVPVTYAARLVRVVSGGSEVRCRRGMVKSAVTRRYLSGG